MHKMFITTFYPRCEGFEPLNMHNCQHPYCFPADQMYRFSQEFSLFHCSELFGILRLTFLSRTISSSSKTSFLFAKLFSVKDYLMFTAKVSDSIDINFISLPHFLCFFFFFWYSQIQIERVNYVEKPLEQQLHMCVFDFRHSACRIMESIQQAIKQVLETKPE